MVGRAGENVCGGDGVSARTRCVDEPLWRWLYCCWAHVCVHRDIRDAVLATKTRISSVGARRILFGLGAQLPEITILNLSKLVHEPMKGSLTQSFSKLVVPAQASTHPSTSEIAALRDGPRPPPGRRKCRNSARHFGSAKDQV